MRVLVVEDDAPLRAGIAGALRARDWLVDEAGDAREARYYAGEYPPDVAIVDLGLPDASGMDLVASLREQGVTVPILILTARDRWQDKVAGLKSGADDYVVKPFHTEELVARLEALVRRAAGFARPVLERGDIRLDTASQVVTVAGQEIELTGFEYRLLEVLMLRAGQVISKSELTDRLYEQDFERDSNTIEVFIGRLRRKLDPDGARQPIETLRGRGYRLG